MNHCLIIGRVKERPEFKETSSGYKVGQVIVESERSYRNSKGEFEQDDFQITVWKSLAEECEERLSVGMLIAVKGRLQANNFKKENDTYYRAEIIAEKIAFLSSEDD